MDNIPSAPDPASEGVDYSVWCSDEGPFYSTQAVQDVAARIPPQFGDFPTERATELREICDLWRVPPVSAADKVLKLSFAPTLTVNGTHDPLTPPMWAKRTAAYLDHAYVELFPGYGDWRPLAWRGAYGGSHDRHGPQSPSQRAEQWSRK